MNAADSDAIGTTTGTQAQGERETHMGDTESRAGGDTPVPMITVDHTPDDTLGGDAPADVAGRVQPTDSDAVGSSEESVATPEGASATPDAGDVEVASTADAPDAADDAVAPGPDEAQAEDSAGSASDDDDAEPTATIAAEADTSSDVQADAEGDQGTSTDDVPAITREPAEATRAAGRVREPITAPRESTPVDPEGAALVARGLIKSFGGLRAVDDIDLTIPTGAFYGLVGPNGAGKTTTLSMLSGLLRPDSGSITVCGVDAKKDPRGAKRMMGVLPDRFRTFDRLTGHQLLHYYGMLRGLKPAVVESRTADLARAFDLTAALGRVVSDYSAGMTKKVMLAGALIHSPRLLVLDEPFESVDPVSSAAILDILTAYVGGGGTVILSSHGMDLVEKVCSRVAVIVGGRVLAEGDVDDVRAGMTLEQRFVELSGGAGEVGGLEWLHSFSG